jgi:hypothetical protein
MKTRKTGPPPKKKGRASKHGPKLLNSAEFASSAATGQARCCLVETPLALYVRKMRGVK